MTLQIQITSVCNLKLPHLHISHGGKYLKQLELQGGGIEGLLRCLLHRLFCLGYCLYVKTLRDFISKWILHVSEVS